MVRACKIIILAFVLPLSINAASNGVSVQASTRQAQEMKKVHQVPLSSILGEINLPVPKADESKESVVSLKALKTQKSNKAASVSAAPAPASAGGPAPASAPASASSATDKETGEKEPKKGPKVDGAPASLDIDTDLPYGELAPFGRESTAIELTEDSILQSNKMVDEIENAEVAEEKRAVFRALTRLRGAAITSFDGIARDQTSNIENYSKQNKWRREHPVKHLADEEADVSRWAFPSNADMLL